MVWICWKWVLLVFECLKTPLIQPCFWKIYLLGTDFWVGRFFFPFSIWKMLLPVSSRMASPKEKAGVTLISVPCQKCGFFNLDALSLVLSHWWWRTLFTVFTKYGKLWPKFLQMLFSVPSSLLSCGETGLPHMRLHGVSHRPLMLISVYSGFFFFLRLFLAGYFNLDSFYYERFKFTSPNLFSVLSFATDQIQCTFHFILISRSLIWDFYIFHVSTFWTFRMEYS